MHRSSFNADSIHARRELNGDCSWIFALAVPLRTGGGEGVGCSAVTPPPLGFIGKVADDVLRDTGMD